MRGGLRNQGADKKCSTPDCTTVIAKGDKFYFIHDASDPRYLWMCAPCMVRASEVGWD